MEQMTEATRHKIMAALFLLQDDAPGLAKRIDIDPQTVRKYAKGLIKRGFLFITEQGPLRERRPARVHTYALTEKGRAQIPALPF